MAFLCVSQVGKTLNVVRLAVAMSASTYSFNLACVGEGDRTGLDLLRHVAPIAILFICFVYMH